MRIGPWTIGRVEEAKLSPIQQRLAAKVSELNEELAGTLLETADLMTNFVDPRERMMGPDGEWWLPVGPGSAGNRLDNRSPTDASNFGNEAALTFARDYCRSLARNNAFAINLHENMVSYIVGSGPRVTIVRKKGMAPDDAEGEDEKLAAMQTDLDEWLWRAKWAYRQQESVVRFDRDGEYFRRFHIEEPEPGDENRLGELCIRFIEPTQIHEPKGNTDPANAFGIKVDPNDVEKVLGYWVDDQLVEPDQIQHIKANVDCNVRRGVPTTYPIREMLRMAVKVLDNIGKVSIIQTKIALIQRYVNATKSGAQSLQSLNADYISTDSKTGRQTTVEHLPDASIIRTKVGTEYEYPAGGIDVVKFGGGVQAILRGAAARCCLPEFMFTSDASNANYASTMVAEGPAVRMFERRQALQNQADLEVYWRWLDHRVAQGVYTQAEVDSVEILVESPSIQVRDQLAEAQAFEIYDRLKIMSKQTMSGKIGVDYKQEQENIDETIEIDAERKAKLATELPMPDGAAAMDALNAMAAEARKAIWRDAPRLAE